MTERTRAQAVLRRAKEILIQRLTDYVLENEEQLLADAGGDSYMADIDTLYDQVGLKLSHITQMLANLPLEQETYSTSTATSRGFQGQLADDTFTLATETNLHADSFVADTMPALPAPVFISTAAITNYNPCELDLADQELGPVSFVLFVSQIRQGDLVEAGKTLARLFAVETARGTRCAAFFAERMERDSNFLNRALQLRTELQSEGDNGPLMMLYECFGLTGIESVAVLQALRLRLET